MNELYTSLGFAPHDNRLVADRHTNSQMPITRFFSREAVDALREELRFNLRMAAGLYPWPEKTPLNPRYEDVGVYEGYSVKKVMFESRPGFWSTGNLYLPHPLPEKAPAILNVIGHWERQRLERSETADYPRQLANFARMGFICLVTDMIGKVDSLQISHEYGQSEEMELWLSNGLGVQLWNNIRALDLLTSMPEVDAEKIGMTGASGGGSQTLLLALLDERIKAAAPINMISLHMQGGCRCENAPGLRRHTDNVQMCAMLAPRALFLAGSTGDWTKYLETDELPAVLEAYRQYDAEPMVEHFYQDAEHQYNDKTRHRVYRFFARHLMGQELNWTELPIEVEDLSTLTWFKGQEHAPGLEGDEEFFAAHKAERVQAMAALPAEEKRRMLAWITGIRENHARYIPLREEACGAGLVKKGVVLGDYGEKLPMVQLIPEDWDGKRVCLVLSGEGKACLGNEKYQAMLREGVALVSGDLFLTGEMAGCQRKVLGSESDNLYFTAFHYTQDALRAQDAAVLMEAAKALGGELTVSVEGAAAAVCALALVDGVKAAWMEEASLNSSLNIPGIRLLGGAEGCLKLALCPVKKG